MSKGRILVIDEERFYRSLYQDLLGEDGYHVRTAADGDEALEFLRLGEYDLVITDLKLIGSDGQQVAEAIRQFHPGQDVMVVTMQQDVATAVEVMKSGVAEYLLKPINPEEFLLVVNRILFRQSLKVEHDRLLDENLEYFSFLAIYDKAMSLLKVHDLDRLVDMILDTFMDLLHAEGAALWLAGYGGMHYTLHCRRGLVRVGSREEVFEPSEAEHHLLKAGEATFVNKGKAVWIPIGSELEPLALIRVESPSSGSVFSRRDLKVANKVGAFAASALGQVLYYRNLEKGTLRVPPGTAYNMPYFRDYMTREMVKARRYGRNLSLLKLRVDNHAEIARDFPARELESTTNALLEQVSSVLRDADIIALENAGEFFILLPETDYWGALVTQRRIRNALKGRLILTGPRRTGQLEVSLRGASFPADGASFEDLVAVADRRMEDLKGSLALRMGIEEMPFWSVVDGLLGGEDDLRPAGDSLVLSARLENLREPRRSQYLRMAENSFDEMLGSFCREVGENRRSRGIIYRGCDDFDRLHRQLRCLEGVERSSTSLHMLGGRKRVEWEYQRICPVYIDEERFTRLPFLLYLNDAHSYGLFARRVEGGLVAFHTSDFHFVESMITKLQEQYQLQAQI